MATVQISYSPVTSQPNPKVQNDTGKMKGLDMFWMVGIAYGTTIIDPRQGGS